MRVISTSVPQFLTSTVVDTPTGRSQTPTSTLISVDMYSYVLDMQTRPETVTRCLPVDEQNPEL